MADRQRPSGPDAEQVAVVTALLSASADVQRLRRTIAEVSAGRADPQAVTDALVEHWRTHGAAHKAVAKLVGEQVRGALVQQLGGWRDQLDRQLALIEAIKQQRSG